MRQIIKKASLLFFLMSLIIGLIGCQVAQKPQTDTYNKEIAKYFPTTQGTTLRYSGTAEHSHTLSLTSVSDTNDTLTLNFSGKIEDMSGSEESPQEQQTFDMEYIINKDSATEVQKDLNKKYAQSIISEQIVLRDPIKVGTKWTQKVVIGDMEYPAETNITDISTENGKSIVKTETIVSDIKGYPNDTYKETRSYREGTGIYEFNNTILIENKETNKVTPFEFGYRLFEEK